MVLFWFRRLYTIRNQNLVCREFRHNRADSKKYALIHRDYTFRGTSIYVMVFDDRVEIESPGGLPFGITKQTFGKASIRRNPIIADLFHRMNKVERIGSGIKRMRELMRNAGLKEPIFEMDSFFRVIFKRNPEYALKGTVGKTVVKTVEKTVVKILHVS